MFKVLPLWTENVTPTKSGKMVDRRDQVLIGLRSFTAFAFCAFINSFSSTKAPLLDERPTVYAFLLLTINRLLRFFRLLVLKPFASFPQALQGWRPPEDFPSPPPRGWSTGFMATPRVFGRTPSHLFRPALPNIRFS